MFAIIENIYINSLTSFILFQGFFLEIDSFHTTTLPPFLVSRLFLEIDSFLTTTLPPFPRRKKNNSGMSNQFSSVSE